MNFKRGGGRGDSILLNVVTASMRTITISIDVTVFKNTMKEEKIT